MQNLVNFRHFLKIALWHRYERLLFNGIVGVQNTAEIGSLSYMTPLGTDVTRTKWDWYGFGNYNNSFWCCYGTTIESFGKLVDSIYFEADVTGTPTLYVMQPMISSTVRWKAGGLQITVAAEQLIEDGAGMAAVSVTFAALRSAANSTWMGPPAGARVVLRIPGWAVPGQKTVVDGKLATPGSFVTISPRAGFSSAYLKLEPKVQARFGVAPKVVPIVDARPEYARVGAVVYGPYVLAGLTAAPATANDCRSNGTISGMHCIDQDPSAVAKWLTVLPGRFKGDLPRFKVQDGGRIVLSMTPLSSTQKETYSVYFNFTGRTPPS